MITQIIFVITASEWVVGMRQECVQFAAFPLCSRRIKLGKGKTLDSETDLPFIQILQQISAVKRKHLPTTTNWEAKILQRIRALCEYVKNVDFINQNEMQIISVIQL